MSFTSSSSRSDGYGRRLADAGNVAQPAGLTTDEARARLAEFGPWDAIRPPLGVLVPADACILSGAVLLDQSTLTGESVLVEANPGSALYAGSMARRS